jgi:hypothetical protein
MTIDTRKVLENATPEQKDRLMELIIRYQNLQRDLAAIEIEFKRERKDLQEPMAATMGAIMEMLEEIESGQMGMSFLDGAEDA